MASMEIFLFLFFFRRDQIKIHVLWVSSIPDINSVDTPFRCFVFDFRAIYFPCAFLAYWYLSWSFPKAYQTAHHDKHDSVSADLMCGSTPKDSLANHVHAFGSPHIYMSIHDSENRIFTTSHTHQLIRDLSKFSSLYVYMSIHDSENRFFTISYTHQFIRDLSNFRFCQASTIVKNTHRRNFHIRQFRVIHTHLFTIRQIECDEVHDREKHQCNPEEYTHSHSRSRKSTIWFIVPI